MNVSLTPELEQFIANKVATGRYGSASEVVRAALRTFEEEEKWASYAREKVAKGIADMEADRIVDGETAMTRIRNAARARTTTRKAS